MALVFLVFDIGCLSSKGLRYGFSAFYGKTPKHKYHLILKLGQINSKFKISMTKTKYFL